MILLLIHQNFPGQFRDLAPAWLKAGHQVHAIGEAIAPQDNSWEGLCYHRYKCTGHPSPGPIERSQAVLEVSRHLQRDGWQPDVVLAHSGWGEALQLKQVWQTCPVVIYPELWGTPRALGFGFDEALDGLEVDPSCFAIPNLLTELAIVQCDLAIVSSVSQLKSFPEVLQQKITLLPEGVDCTNVEYSAQKTTLTLSGEEISENHPVVTLISRGLEPLRGLRQAMRAWPLVTAEIPEAHLVLIGQHGLGYGLENSKGDTHLNDALDALPPEVNQKRIHNVGWVSHTEMLRLLRSSTCHLALSYPYTLSWSVLESMACGCPMVSNYCSPIAHYLIDGENGLLVDFNKEDEIAQAILRLMKNKLLCKKLGKAARKTIQDNFESGKTLAAYEKIFQNLAFTSDANSPDRGHSKDYS